MQSSGRHGAQSTHGLTAPGPSGGSSYRSTALVALSCGMGAACRRLSRCCVSLHRHMAAYSRPWCCRRYLSSTACYWPSCALGGPSSLFVPS